MGLLVRQVLERAAEEAFEAGGVARPAWDVLEDAIDDNDLSMTLESVRPYGDIPPDGLAEFYDDSMEIVEVKNATGPIATLQTRGYLSTTADDHLAGTKVIFDNPYPRQVLLNGLKAIIGQLRGYGLYGIGFTDDLTLSTITPVVLPTGAKSVLGIVYRNGSNWFPIPTSGYRTFHNWTGLNTAPAVQFFQGIQGAETKIYYKSDFILPDDDDGSPFVSVLDWDLDDSLIPESLQFHLATALAGHVLMGRDVPLLESEHVRPDPQNPQQPGVRMSVGKALWDSFIQGAVATERVKQLEAYPTQTTGV